MDNLVKAFGGLVITASLLFLSALLGTLGGAFTGWVVGFFFSDTILGVLGQMGIHEIHIWQYGAFLGFTGSFFRAHLRTS